MSLKTAASTTKNLYTIPATVSFVDSLAAGLWEEVQQKPEKLAQYLILLPTRRACRSLQEGFLRQTSGKPIMLPKLQSFADIDAEELSIATTGNLELDIPPAMSALKRQILLAQTISKLPDFTKGPQQDMALASALGRLMDQIHTENLSLDNLPDLVDRELFAKHWQITIDFLKILSEHWPKVLEENGVIDSADRRNRLINALNQHWQINPPKHPVIAAGSTGSIPATAQLLKTILSLPEGAVILPGLDQTLPDKAWDFVKEGHPQATLKQLLGQLEYSRQNVQNWPHTAKISTSQQAREKIISYVMAPAEKTNEWQNVELSSQQKKDVETTLNNIKRYDCATSQEEAQLISLLLREVLEDETKTAALITSDRKLAHRVVMACRRWDIEIDDSGGQTLANTSLGKYIRLSAQAALDNVKPSSFLSLLKHHYAQGNSFENYRQAVRRLEHDLLRGLKPEAGFDGIHKRFQEYTEDPERHRKPDPQIIPLLDHLSSFMEPFIEKMTEGFHDFSDLLREHIRLAEKLATTQKESGETILWQGEEGEAATKLLSDLQDQATHIPSINGQDYLAILDQLMKTVTIRPRFGTHPRLLILGQLEARLIQADRVILGGLNEGSWPPDPANDPWMSRPMRESFGLPTPERSIGLAAHDFVQGFCNGEVFLTRAERADGVPTVPARWLQRLETFLQAINIDPSTLTRGPHQDYLSMLDEHGETNAVPRPAPKPPVALRPRELSVTKIETWLKDPYAIYAQKILKLKKLDPLEKKSDSAERGIILHEILEDFTKQYKKDVPESARDDFITLARGVFDQKNGDATQWSFWKPRLARVSDWLIPHEQEWRKTADFKVSEAKGSLILTENLVQPFALSARADRIDKSKTGGAILIDYKSGGTYSKSKMASGELPQLPLEALILNEGGFYNAGIEKQEISSIGYWKLTGGKPAGEIIELNDPEKLNNAIEQTKAGLLNLVQTFDDENIPYYAIPRLDNPPRFNDYEHLERVKEWAALDENSEEAA